jgi:hypothetical protein
MVVHTTTIVTCCCDHHVSLQEQMRKPMSINHSVNSLSLRIHATTCIYIYRQSHHIDCQLSVCVVLSFSSSISNQHNMLFYVLLLWHTDDDHISSSMMISFHPIALFLKKKIAIYHSFVRSFVLAHSRCLFTLVL